MEWFFGGWEGLARVIIFAVCAYLAFTLIIRLSGKRTLSKLNTFDMILSIAIGSLLGRTILAKDVALIEGIAALATLIIMQVLFTRLSIRSPRVRRLVQGYPTLLFYDGEYIEHVMHRHRVVRQDVQEAVRARGLQSMEQVAAVVIEADGRFSVIPQGDRRVSEEVLEGVVGSRAGGRVL